MMLVLVLVFVFVSPPHEKHVRRTRRVKALPLSLCTGATPAAELTTSNERVVYGRVELPLNTFSL